MKLRQIVYQGKTRKGTEIIIRYPTINDVSLLLDFINEISQEQTYIRFQGEILSIDEETKYLKSFLDKIEKNRAVKLMVFHGNKMIGVSDIDMYDKIQSHVGLFGIIIAKNYRGEGIGKLLMELVIDEAKKNIQELKMITLTCFANNPIGPPLYKKMGFVEHGFLPQGCKHKGQLVDYIYMYKKIS